MDVKDLARAAAALKRLNSEYQEKEGLLAVFRSAEKVIGTLIAAETAVGESVKRKDDLEREIRALGTRIEERKESFRLFEIGDNARRAAMSAETDELLEKESAKRGEAKARMLALESDFKAAGEKLTDDLAELKAEYDATASALDEIKEQIRKLKGLAG